MTLVFLLCALLPVEEQYQAGSYEKVVELAPAALADPLTGHSDSARINTVYGSALVALGRNLEAADVFRSLLRLEPECRLNPEQFSPKIMQVFDGVRAELALHTQPSAVRVDTVFTRPKPSIAVLAPGLFQVESRKPAKGYTLLGLGILSVAGLTATHLLYNDAHRDYLAAASPADVKATYQKANSLSHARFAFGCTLAGTWLYSLVDGLLGL
jgi:hypothetical protein